MHGSCIQPLLLHTSSATPSSSGWSWGKQGRRPSCWLRSWPLRPASFAFPAPWEGHAHCARSRGGPERHVCSRVGTVRPQSSRPLVLPRVPPASSPPPKNSRACLFVIGALLIGVGSLVAGRLVAIMVLGLDFKVVPGGGGRAGRNRLLGTSALLRGKSWHGALAPSQSHPPFLSSSRPVGELPKPIQFSRALWLDVENHALGNRVRCHAQPVPNLPGELGRLGGLHNGVRPTLRHR